MQRKTSSGAGLYYIHTDLLSSIERITNATGQLVSEYIYTPWGGRVLLSGVNITDRGYTGHEHLNPFGDDSNGGFCLINMNGRIYDPVLARFLSPDPHVQAPDFTQSFNRYAYGWNNPFKYTDPSGNSIVAAILIGGGINLVSQILAGNVSSVQDAYLAFGIGGLSGWAGAGIGQVVAGAFTTATTLGSAIGQGALIGASGGAAGGFIGGAGNAWFNGVNFREGLKSGLISGGYGTLGGALFGGVSGGIQYQRQNLVFQKGCVDLCVDAGDPVPATDQFLSDAQKVWFKDAPMNNVNKFTVEKVSVDIQLKMDQAGAPGCTRYLHSGGVLTGNSNVYFNKNLAFSSAKQLFFTMGHELVHVSQFAAMAGQYTSILKQSFIFDGETISFINDMMEFHAYSFQHSVGGTQLNSFPRDLVSEMEKQWPGYFKMLGFSNFGWTNTSLYKYPFQ